jgi:hypothetical protein
METVIEDAQRTRYPVIGLTTRRDAPWNKPFYQSLGFTETTAAHDMAGPSQDAGKGNQ